MSDAYEEFADMFMTTLTGQLSGMTRDEVVALVKSRMPNEEEFRQHMIGISQMVEEQMSQIQSALSGQNTVVIPRNSTLH